MQSTEKGDVTTSAGQSGAINPMLKALQDAFVEISDEGAAEGVSFQTLRELFESLEPAEQEKIFALKLDKTAFVMEQAVRRLGDGLAPKVVLARISQDINNEYGEGNKERKMLQSEFDKADNAAVLCSELPPLVEEAFDENGDVMVDEDISKADDVGEHEEMGGKEVGPVVVTTAASEKKEEEQSE